MRIRPEGVSVVFAATSIDVFGPRAVLVDHLEFIVTRPSSRREVAVVAVGVVEIEVGFVACAVRVNTLVVRKIYI